MLSNSKEDALNRVFGDSSTGKNGTEQSTGLKELTLSIIDEVRRLPGNNICCDCDAPGKQSFETFELSKSYFKLALLTQAMISWIYFQELNFLGLMPQSYCDIF